jgi:hypothetical protein
MIAIVAFRRAAVPLGHSSAALTTKRADFTYGATSIRRWARDGRRASTPAATRHRDRERGAQPLYLRRKSPRRGAATMSRGGTILRARTGRQCLCSFGGMADMVEHIHVPFGSALFHTSPPRAASSRRLTLRKILDVIRLLLVC